MTTEPTATICMCNKNMSATLKQSIESIVKCMPNDFEILVVDDNSIDDSRTVLDQLKSNNPRLRTLYLQEDLNRKLGETRNIAIHAARGKYCFLQLDCDDEYFFPIGHFVNVYENLKLVKGHDFYLKSDSINVAKRDWLLNARLYNNVFRGEDKQLWTSLALSDEIIKVEVERPWRQILKSDKTIKIKFFNLLDFYINELQYKVSAISILRYNLNDSMRNPKSLLKLLVLLLAVIKTKRVNFSGIDYNFIYKYLDQNTVNFEDYYAQK